jgi:hypothetical protein
MAYPTTLKFRILDPIIGAQPIDETSTTRNHPLGTIVNAEEYSGLTSTAFGYGAGEYIYLTGVASTAKGDAVAYDLKAGTTTRAVAASRGRLAIAMSANVASQYGWYLIAGAGVASTASAGTGAANPNLVISATDGQLTVASTGATCINGIKCTGAQDGPGAGFTAVQLDRPFVPGFTITQP